MFGTKHLETNALQKAIACKTKKQSTKYSNWNIQIEV